MGIEIDTSLSTSSYAQAMNTLLKRALSVLDRRGVTKIIELAMAAGQQPVRLLPNSVRHVVAISSGKGGVGKSTTAVNIATALANRLNLRVGLLDADVYGPSIPRLMNLSGIKPEVKAFTIPGAGATRGGSGADNEARGRRTADAGDQRAVKPSSFLSRLWGGGGDAKEDGARAVPAANVGAREVHKLVPLVNHNVKCMSLGFMIADAGAGAGHENAADRAVAWRGPMASSSLSRLVADTYWGDLDVLLVDMPPGTGDIQITYVPCLLSSAPLCSCTS